MATKSLRQEIGATGTIMIGGIISEDDYNKELTGTNGLKEIDKMRKGDATVRVALLAVKLPILAAHWFMTPASEDKQDQMVSDFVEQQLMQEMSITWQDFLRESLLFLDYGHYVWELVYKDVIFNGRRYLGLKKLSPRLPATIWAWKMKNGEDGIQQFTLENGQVDIPIEKILILVNEKEGGNWKGTSILRSAYKHWYIKDTIYKIDAIAHERQGLGIPYVKRGATGTTTQDKNKSAEILQNMRANEKGYLDIPGGWDIGFMDMKAGQTRNPKDTIMHHDRQITKAVMAQFLELGANSTGSYALSADQSDLFMLALQSVAQQFRDATQKYIIERLVDLNFTVEKYPQLDFENIGKIDYANLSAALQRLSQSGLITADPEMEKYLRKVMDLPEMPEEMELTEENVNPELNKLYSEFADVELMSKPQEPMQAAEKIVEYANLPLTGDEKDKMKKKIAKKLEQGKTLPKEYLAEIETLRQEVSGYDDSLRKQILEHKAKGRRLTKQEHAKLMLQVLDGRTALSQKLRQAKARLAAASVKQFEASEGFLGIVEAFRDSIREIASHVKPL